MTRIRITPAMEEIESVTITDFKASAREVIDLVRTYRAIAVLRHNAAEAVLIPASDYAEFVNLKRERLDVLKQQYDDMVTRMQSPESAAGVDALFSATSEELGRAAIAAGQRD